MRLEMHDDRYEDPIKDPAKQSGPTHRATVRVDYEYQAEMWVDESFRDEPGIVQWLLYDEIGLCALWVRAVNTPVLVAKGARYEGRWKPTPGWLLIPRSMGAERRESEP